MQLSLSGGALSDLSLSALKKASTLKGVLAFLEGPSEEKKNTESYKNFLLL